jgi:hypothetical protein
MLALLLVLALAAVAGSPCLVLSTYVHGMLQTSRLLVG